MQKLSPSVGLIALSLALTACATPVTTLKNPKTKQVVTCGGDSSASMAGGVIGSNIQKNSDEKCVNSYISQGFKVESQTKE